MKKLIISVALVCALSFSFLLTASLLLPILGDFIFPESREVIFSAHSPNRRYEVIIVEKNVHLTTPFTYDFRMRRFGTDEYGAHIFTVWDVDGKGISATLLNDGVRLKLPATYSSGPKINRLDFDGRQFEVFYSR